ncbi:MAG: hypothetical protein WBZ20_19060, partial [Nitrososphaeraceae archaeon]
IAVETWGSIAFCSIIMLWVHCITMYIPSYHYNNTPKLHINSKRHTNYMCMGSSQEATVL